MSEYTSLLAQLLRPPGGLLSVPSQNNSMLGQLLQPPLLRASGLLTAPNQNNSLAQFLLPPLPYSPPQWIAVTKRFEEFNKNLSLTTLQRQDGQTKRSGVVSCLNRHYYGSTSGTDNSFLVGSWSKGTAIRPPRDVDMCFVLPVAVYNRLQGHRWNRQSALLQEVKDVLADTYPDTDMRGDGQVVMVGFETFNVEVAPAFLLTNDRFWVCDTNDGGSYKETDPRAEVNNIEAVDQANNRNLRPLIRMLKAWQANCSVPIKSFQLELLAADFIAKSPWRLNNFFYFDWITRDFFAYLYNRANTAVVVPGTLELIYIGNEWQSRSESAYYRAVKACEYEKINSVYAAGEEWQKIFGQQIPWSV